MAIAKYPAACPSITHRPPAPPQALCTPAPMTSRYAPPPSGQDGEHEPPKRCEQQPARHLWAAWSSLARRDRDQGRASTARRLRSEIASTPASPLTISAMIAPSMTSSTCRARMSGSGYPARSAKSRSRPRMTAWCARVSSRSHGSPPLRMLRSGVHECAAIEPLRFEPGSQCGYHSTQLHRRLRPGRVERREDRLALRRSLPRQHLAQQRLLRPEAAVKRHLRRARFRKDAVDSSRMDPVAAEQLARHLDDALVRRRAGHFGVDGFRTCGRQSASLSGNLA